MCALAVFYMCTRRGVLFYIDMENRSIWNMLYGYWIYSGLARTIKSIGVSHGHKSHRISRVLFVLKKKSKFIYFSPYYYTVRSRALHFCAIKIKILPSSYIHFGLLYSAVLWYISLLLFQTYNTQNKQMEININSTRPQ